MVDLEKGDDQEGMDTPARQVPAMADEDKEQEHRILQDWRVNQVIISSSIVMRQPGLPLLRFLVVPVCSHMLIDDTIFH